MYSTVVLSTAGFAIPLSRSVLHGTGTPPFGEGPCHFFEKGMKWQEEGNISNIVGWIFWHIFQPTNIQTSCPIKKLHWEFSMMDKGL